MPKFKLGCYILPFYALYVFSLIMCFDFTRPWQGLEREKGHLYLTPAAYDLHVGWQDD